jgi:hypothetical protein
MYITDADGHHKVNKMAKDTPVSFSKTRERETGGNTSVKKTAEQHDSRKDLGTRNGQSYSISRCLNDDKAAILDDSKVSGSRREPSAVAKVRSANNLRRDQNTNLGRGKSSDVVLGG